MIIIFLTLIYRIILSVFFENCKFVNRIKRSHHSYEDKISAVIEISIYIFAVLLSLISTYFLADIVSKYCSEDIYKILFLFE